MDIITALGGVSAVARMVGCKPPSVMEWRKRGVPTERCPAIERSTGGAFACEALRPDVAWHRVADTDWPWHPQGRPLIDVARPAPTCAAIRPPCGVAQPQEAGHAG